MDVSKINGQKYETEIMHANYNCDATESIIPCLVLFNKPWITTHNAYHKQEPKYNDFSFIQKNGRRYDH